MVALLLLLAIDDNPGPYKHISKRTRLAHAHPVRNTHPVHAHPVHAHPVRSRPPCAQHRGGPPQVPQELILLLPNLAAILKRGKDNTAVLPIVEAYLLLGAGTR